MIEPELKRAEEEGWRELHALVERIPPSEVERPGYFAEGWSAKDLIAHLGTWLAQAGVALEQIASGTYQPEDIDVDAVNGRHLETMRGMPLDVVRAQAEASRARMLMAWADVPGESPEAGFWVGKAGPEHYEEHLPRLREWVKEVAP